MFDFQFGFDFLTNPNGIVCIFIAIYRTHVPTQFAKYEQRHVN